MYINLFYEIQQLASSLTERRRNYVEEVTPYVFVHKLLKNLQTFVLCKHAEGSNDAAS
jgi:hypothetical protein